jgi:phytoene desaturase
VGVAEPSVIIIGGGLAGLAAGCYARASGFHTQIVEHAASLGGVCTAWQRAPYLVDGCIHWLTGGPFARVYAELGILDRVALRPIQHFVSLRDVQGGAVVDVTSDLDALGRRLSELAPEDAEEIRRLCAGARRVADLAPPLDKASDLLTLRDGLRMFWEMRHELGTLMHFRQPLGQYVDDHFRSAIVRQLLASFLPKEAPALFLLLMLGYLERGWLSRPVGGSAAFRDALVDSYQKLGGEARLSTTVEEILVDADRARGVRLSDGTILEADAVISTSSTPETVFRLLGGRYDAAATARRLRDWKLFTPIVLASYGVAMPLRHLPPMLLLSGVEPFEVGGVANDRLYLRLYNDDPCFAPPGHSVVQAVLETDYNWWARLGTESAAEKARVAERVLSVIERYLPGMHDACRMSDVATPLTYWNTARSWRGAYEGWLPSGNAGVSAHLPHRLPGLPGLYVAGQWVEPGGGVPTACASGRQVVQVMCVDHGRAFASPHSGVAASGTDV